MGNRRNKKNQKYDDDNLEFDIFEESTEVNTCDEVETNTDIKQATNTNKRHFENDKDSDSEAEVIQKKSKKKKKQIVPLEDTEPSNKKNKKSIRQIKKEKHAQRQAEAAAAAKDQLKSQCLNYLSQWKHDKPNWKFMKAKQVWLYKNKFSKHLIPESSWPLLLEYFESAQGNIRKMLLDDANKVIKQMDDWTKSQEKKESDEVIEDEEESSSKPDSLVYNRARSLIQCLQ